MCKSNSDGILVIPEVRARSVISGHDRQDISPYVTFVIPLKRNLIKASW